MSLIFISLFAVWILQSIGWGLSTFFKKNHIADIFWGIGIWLITFIAFVINGFSSFAMFMVFALTSVWAARLSITIYQRNKGKAEDRRYQEMSKDWKNPKLQSYLVVWMLQGGLMMLLGMSALSLTGHSGFGSGNMIILGTLLWAVGFYFEYIGDKELAAFKAKPENKGKIMTQGLWAKTRHPNYFGEVTMWWGIFFIACSTSGWWFLMALITPVTITYLILKVSGIPMAENHYAGREDWEAYKKKTNMFFPSINLK